MSGDLNLPFEPTPGDPGSNELDLTDPLLSGGVVVMAAMIPTEDGGNLPGLVFRFAKPDGTGFHPPMLLACDEPDNLRALIPLVRDAVNGAISAAGRRE